MTGGSSAAWRAGVERKAVSLKGMSTPGAHEREVENWTTVILATGLALGFWRQGSIELVAEPVTLVWRCRSD